MLSIEIYWNNDTYFGTNDIDAAMDHIEHMIQFENMKIKKCFVTHSQEYTKQEVEKLKDIFNNIFMLYKNVGIEVEVFEYAG